jgi:hypothetical protein
MTKLTSEFYSLKTQAIHRASISPNPLEPPSAWMRYGTSPTEIILATAIVIIANAVVIRTITLLVQALVRQDRLQLSVRED